MQHLLIVANQTAVGVHLTSRVYGLRGRDPDTHVFVVVPATPRSIPAGQLADAPLADADGRRRAARQLKASIEMFENIGVHVRGEVGPADPMEAARRVMVNNTFDRVIVSTLELGASRWLNMDLPHRMERRFKIPVEHIVGKGVSDGWDVPVPSQPMDRVRVLLIEDSKDDIFLMKESLDRSGFDIDLTIASNGARALEFLEANGTSRIDLVLLDLKMPVVDGHSFLELVARDHDVDQLNVTVVTTSDWQPDRERAYALGADAYILKDPDFDSFCEVVNSVVSEIAHSD